MPGNTDSSDPHTVLVNGLPSASMVQKQTQVGSATQVSPSRQTHSRVHINIYRAEGLGHIPSEGLRLPRTCCAAGELR